MSSVSFITVPTNQGSSFSLPVKHGVNSSKHTLSKSLSQNQEPDNVEISTTGRENLEQVSDKQILELEKNSKRTDKLSKDQELSRGEQVVIEQLKRVDREVRNHELAHKAAAGSFAKGGTSLKYTIGPDGKKYVVGGHVNIDTSTIPNNPEATIRKAQSIRSAALAPANPSSQDRSVAASAVKMESDARMKIREEQKGESDDVTQVNNDKNKTNVNSIFPKLLKNNVDTFYSVGSILDTQV